MKAVRCALEGAWSPEGLRPPDAGDCAGQSGGYSRLGLGVENEGVSSARTGVTGSTKSGALWGERGSWGAGPGAGRGWGGWLMPHVSRLGDSRYRPAVDTALSLLPLEDESSEMMLFFCLGPANTPRLLKQHHHNPSTTLTKQNKINK